MSGNARILTDEHHYEAIRRRVYEGCSDDEVVMGWSKEFPSIDIALLRGEATKSNVHRQGCLKKYRQFDEEQRAQFKEERHHFINAIAHVGVRASARFVAAVRRRVLKSSHL